MTEDYYRQILRGTLLDEEFLQTLSEYEYFYPRRSGRTTRIIDFSIQKLFIEKELRFMDHFPTRNARKHGWTTFLDRLYHEHFRGGLKEVFIIRNDQFFIKFKDGKNDEYSGGDDYSSSEHIRQRFTNTGFSYPR